MGLATSGRTGPAEINATTHQAAPKDDGPSGNCAGDSVRNTLARHVLCPTPGQTKMCCGVVGVFWRSSLGGLGCSGTCSPFGAARRLVHQLSIRCAAMAWP
eukprot:9481189-Alexandrium_andersonii.AAC.1